MTKNIILCDLDHTACDSSWRDWMVKEPMTQGAWDEYNSMAQHDKPVEDVVVMLWTLYESGDYDIIYLTARNEKWRKMTTDWLSEYCPPGEALLMRPDDCRESSPRLKMDLAKEYLGDLSMVALVIDDREDVAVAFQKEGVTVLQTRIAINGGRYHARVHEAAGSPDAGRGDELRGSC